MLEGPPREVAIVLGTNVTIVKHFAQIGDIALPTSIESVADVGMVGQATFLDGLRLPRSDGRNVTHSRRPRSANTRRLRLGLVRPGSN